jgi:ABC-2 type transport system permease protein
MSAQTVVALPRPGSSWRIWRMGILNEAAFPVRLAIHPVMLAVQLFLYYQLWTAVYRHTTVAAGLTGRQAVSYALIALLIARTRWNLRFYSKDSVSIRVREGTIVYWFLRPISPRRYYLLRQLGDMLYGGVWALLGYVIVLAAGAVDGPPSLTAALAVVASLVLGQVILYYLGALVDLCTFWLINVTGVTVMYFFLQSLLAGVFVPIYFFPGWLKALAQVLPFGAAVNVPLSLYVGIEPLHKAPAQLAFQLAWIAVLAVFVRWVWSRASRRVTVQGG